MVIVPLATVLITHLRQSLHRQGINIVDSLEIPVNQIKNCYPVKYGSAIALKLTHFLDQSPLDIADRIVGSLENLDPAVSSLGGICPQDFTIKIIPPGMIEFTFTDQAIATWLEQISQNLFPIPVIEKNLEVTPNLFSVQYSHARCCSLLRLAHREKMITLKGSEATPGQTFPAFQITEPIPWLTDRGKLRFIAQSEYQLLTKIVEVVDHLESSFHPQRWEKIAYQFSETFQQFYSQCQIWGEVKRHTPELAQARLGLVLITRSLLHFLLQEKLGVDAPLEL